MTSACFRRMVILLGVTLIPVSSAVGTGIVEGPRNSTIAIDPACVERDEAPHPGETRRELQSNWIDCEFGDKRVTLMLAALPQVLRNWNDFQSNKTDNIYEAITSGTDWFQLRTRIYFWGWSSQGIGPPVTVKTSAWLCANAEKRCGKPEKFIELKIIGAEAATIALLAIGDFEISQVKARDGKSIGIKWHFPEPVEKMIANFDFEKAIEGTRTQLP